MSLIKTSIRFPVTVFVYVLIGIIGGFVALRNIPIQRDPEVKGPIITVTTNWFGASPEEIEKEIVDQQEAYLESVEGLLEMKSTFSDGQGVITLEFIHGTDMTATLVGVTNKLNEILEYPDDADHPIVTISTDEHEK